MRDATKGRIMTETELCAEMRVTPRWLKRHRHELPFIRRLSTRLIVYDRAGFERWWAVAGTEPLTEPLKKFSP